MKRINNYHELAVEKQRLKQQIDLLKRDVDNEIHEIKQNFKPLTKIVGLFSGNSHDDNGHDGEPKKESLLKTGLKAGASLGMDILVGSKFRKAGMITRLIVPPLLRGISSGILKRFGRKKK